MVKAQLILKTLFLFIFFLLSSCIGPGRTVPAVEGEYSVTVRVNNIDPKQGVLRMAIYNDKNMWLREPGSVRGRLHMALNKQEEVHFFGLPPGEYAIAMYHDANGDNKLNMLLGVIPLERYGFSNSAKGFLGVGLPSFNQAKFIIPEDKVVDINLGKPFF